MALTFIRSFEPRYGESVVITPLVRRVTARNPGPFTFTGTNTFIIGRGGVALIDPGPDDADHREALLRAVAGERVTHILLTHSHLDHSAGLAALLTAIDAPVHGGADVGEERLDRSVRPDIVLFDGMRIPGDGWELEAVATPGHLGNHFAFALAGSDILLVGDHVMAWSTTVVVPPLGNMADYRASLQKLLARPENAYLPAHGPALPDAKTFVRELAAHRDAREAAVVGLLGEGPASIEGLVLALYPGLAPNLLAAAAGSVLAHIEELVARGVVTAAGGSYRLA